MRTIIIGHIGSDAGYWVIDGKGIHHVGGWAPEQLAEFRGAVTVMAAATHLKTPGLAEAAIKSVQSFAEKQLGEHLGAGGAAAGGTVVIVMA